MGRICTIALPFGSRHRNRTYTTTDSTQTERTITSGGVHNEHEHFEQNVQKKHACGYRPCCSYYLTNIRVLLPIQFLVVAAFLLAFSMLSECKIVRLSDAHGAMIDTFSIDTIYNGTMPSLMHGYKNSTMRTLGIYSWENIDGFCISSTVRRTPNILQSYWDNFLDQDWYIVFHMANVTFVFALIVAIWVVCVLSCVVHTQFYRIILAILLSMVLPICLSTVLIAALTTDICMMYKCNVAISGSLGAISAIMNAIAGFLVFNLVTKDTAVLQNHMNCNNLPSTSNDGIADAVEISVEMGCIDHTLITHCKNDSDINSSSTNADTTNRTIAIQEDVSNDNNETTTSSSSSITMPNTTSKRV